MPVSNVFVFSRLGHTDFPLSDRPAAPSQAPSFDSALGPATASGAWPSNLPSQSSLIASSPACSLHLCWACPVVDVNITDTVRQIIITLVITASSLRRTPTTRRRPTTGHVHGMPLSCLIARVGQSHRGDQVRRSTAPAGAVQQSRRLRWTARGCGCGGQARRV